MELFLHSPNIENKLSEQYQRAFKNAMEIYVVSAYLTSWDSTLSLGANCQRFKIIIGKDFGITRKKACKDLMSWLPSGRKHQFLVAENISGFHPKSVFWKEKSGKCYAIIGSSNLTTAAFEKNYEANTFGEVSAEQFAAAKKWLASIERLSIPMSDGWLKNYTEATQTGSKGSPQKPDSAKGVATEGTAIEIPSPDGMGEQIENRRKQLAIFEKNRKKLLALMRACANKEISSDGFFEKLPKFWSYEVGDRLQGAGWERTGKDSDFHEFCQSFLRIHDAAPDERDEVLVVEIDHLKKEMLPTRGALLSEMLCLFFQSDYPVLNKPVKKYLKHIGFSAPRGSSSGDKYLYLARMLRHSLRSNPSHPARNLAELDTVIWLAFGD